MTGGKHGPAVGTALGDKEGLARSEVTKDGQVVDGATRATGELETRWFMVKG